MLGGFFFSLNKNNGCIIAKSLFQKVKVKKFGTKILKISSSTTFIRGTRVVKCVGLKKKFDLIIVLP